jgi:hypothetical protein
MAMARVIRQWVPTLAWGRTVNIEDALSVVTAALASVGSAGVVMFGLSNWLGKVWANRILEADRAEYSKLVEKLREDGQKRILVHRVQFETEFQAYREVWEAIAGMVVAALQLRPILESGVDFSAPEEVRRNTKLERFAATANCYLDVARRYHPFLAREVDQECERLFKLLQQESIDYQYAKEDRVGVQKYWESQKENHAMIEKQARIVADSIQRRIGLLEVANA